MTTLLDPSSRSLVFAVFSVFVVICLMLCIVTGADEDDRALVRSDSRRLRSWQQGVAMGGDTTTVATVTVLVGMVATSGFDGLGVMLGSLVGVLLLLVLVVEPLREHASRTAADMLDARGSGGPRVRVSWGVVTLLVCFPLLVVQLVVVGNVAAALVGQPGVRTGCIVVIGCVMTALAVSGGIRGTGVVMLAKSAIALPVLLVAAVLVLHRFGWDPGRLLDAAAHGSGTGGAFLRPGGYTGEGWVGAVNRIGQTVGMSMATLAMPAVLMRAISTKSPRGARSGGRWMLGELTLLYGALAVVGVGAAALVGGALREAGPAAQVFTPLMLGRALDSGGILVAALACVLFLTALAAVVDVTLAAGIALGRDVLGASGKVDGAASRWSAALTGVVSSVAAAVAADWNLVVISTLWLALCGAALAPVLLYALYWPGFTARGALWCLWGATALSVAALALSPYTSGTPGSLFPGHDFRIWDVTIPGLVTVPAGFLLGWLGSVTDPRRAAGGVPGAGRRRELDTV
ncbi:sodium:solute symporter family transporter [Streptomyces griseoflavus]|uniref:Transmembrane transporter n=1 Tax=Streptomyces griseoflavus Tu4000 TaxID=467200 RepID=D9XZY1_9ACTN|nr:transporter [Streptomyces griseoflavus]EFL38420.1 transmembrane transporter [Streptomyces griseoflavus Tu4000]